MDKENVVIVFAKWPSDRFVKTRIARDTSPGFSRDFNIACINDLIRNINGSRHYELVFGVDTEIESLRFKEAYGLNSILSFEGPVKSPSTISEKFDNIFHTALERKSFKRAVLIPTDIPYLHREELTHSFERLIRSKFVIGPEKNGGIYLIGLKKPYGDDVFKNVRWSTTDSSQDLMRNFLEQEVTVLVEKNDLNTLKEVYDSIDAIRERCPEVFSLVQRLDETRHMNLRNITFGYSEKLNTLEKMEYETN